MSGVDFVCVWCMHVHTRTCERMCACVRGTHTGHGDVAVNYVEVCVQVHCLWPWVHHYNMLAY